ncbi:hypothetical protein YC2023_052217 [Brassica napus]
MDKDGREVTHERIDQLQRRINLSHKPFASVIPLSSVKTRPDALSLHERKRITLIT